MSLYVAFVFKMQVFQKISIPQKARQNRIFATKSCRVMSLFMCYPIIAMAIADKNLKEELY